MELSQTKSDIFWWLWVCLPNHRGSFGLWAI